MKRAATLICLLVFSFATAARAEPVEDRYLSLRQQYRDFLADIPAQHKRPNWDRFISEFWQFAQTNPRHDRADDAIFLAGDANERLAKWKSSNETVLREALKAYDALVRLYPGSNLADDALWRAGQILEIKLGDSAEAYLLYRSIVAGYPDADYFIKAQEGLERLSALAPPEILAPPPTPIAEPTPPPAPVEPLLEPATPPTPIPEAAPEMSPRPAAATSEIQPAAPSLPATVNRLTRVAFWALDSRAFLTFYLDAPVSPEVAVQPAADAPATTEIRLTLPSVEIAGELTMPAPVRPLEAIVIDSSNGRLVVRLRSAALQGYSINQLPDPHRLVVEMRMVAGGQTTSRKIPSERVIILDPGHGGDDLGAHNQWLIEKHLTLALAKKIRDRLQKKPGAIVILTRESDLFLPLDTRYALANDLQAAALISLHVNASPRPESNGIESYLFDSAGADADEDTVKRENQAGQNHVNSTYPYIAPEKRLELMGASRQLADDLQRSLLASARQSRPRAANRGIKSAPLLVLAGARVPAVLMEIGFATHPEEAKLLTQDAYLDQLADGLTEGIDRYLDSLAAAED